MLSGSTTIASGTLVDRGVGDKHVCSADFSAVISVGVDYRVRTRLQRHCDLADGWYDAGDYGKYGGNQWGGAEIALAYVRYAGNAAVVYDNDAAGVPDLIDKAMFGSEYIMKFADQFGGAVYDLKNNASFHHPETTTDNISGPTIACSAATASAAL